MAEVAVLKRLKINKIQQQIMLAVLAASLVVGTSIVFMIYFGKYIAFNTTVISEKDKSISNYYSAIKDAGICVPKSSDGKFSDADLKECDPKSIDVASIPGTLRYNIMIGTTENHNLESVARDAQATCYGSDGKKINFTEYYRKADTDEKRASYLNMIKLCSSLRVVPDALPASKNEAALMSSMNQIFNMSNVEVKSLAPSESFETSDVSSVENLPVTVTYDGTVTATTRLLRNLEKSIRSFSFNAARMTWKPGGGGLELSATADAFYTKQVKASETTKTIYASKEAKKAALEAGEMDYDESTEPEVVE